MENHCSLPKNTTNEGVDQGSDAEGGDGVCEAKVSRGSQGGVLGKGCPNPWPERGGLLTEEELTAKGHRKISVTYLTELHEIAIHKFNGSATDFSMGFWNGYGCAIKAVLEKLEDFT